MTAVHDDLWRVAAADLEAEQAEQRLSVARVRAAAEWSFMAAAGSRAEYAARARLVDARVAAAADSVSPGDGELLARVRRGMAEDWLRLHSARMVTALAEGDQVTYQGSPYTVVQVMDDGTLMLQSTTDASAPPVTADAAAVEPVATPASPPAASPPPVTAASRLDIVRNRLAAVAHLRARQGYSREEWEQPWGPGDDYMRARGESHGSYDGEHGFGQNYAEQDPIYRDSYDRAWERAQRENRRLRGSEAVAAARELDAVERALAAPSWGRLAADGGPPWAKGKDDEDDEQEPDSDSDSSSDDSAHDSDDDDEKDKDDKSADDDSDSDEDDDDDDSDDDKGKTSSRRLMRRRADAGSDTPGSAASENGGSYWGIVTSDGSDLGLWYPSEREADDALAELKAQYAAGGALSGDAPDPDNWKVVSKPNMDAAAVARVRGAYVACPRCRGGKVASGGECSACEGLGVVPRRRQGSRQVTADNPASYWDYEPQVDEGERVRYRGADVTTNEYDPDLIGREGTVVGSGYHGFWQTPYIEWQTDDGRRVRHPSWYVERTTPRAYAAARSQGVFHPDEYGSARYEDPLPTQPEPSWINDEWGQEGQPWFPGPTDVTNPADGDELRQRMAANPYAPQANPYYVGPPAGPDTADTGARTLEELQRLNDAPYLGGPVSDAVPAPQPHPADSPLRDRARAARQARRAFSMPSGPLIQMAAEAMRANPRLSGAQAWRIAEHAALTYRPRASTG